MDEMEAWMAEAGLTDSVKNKIRAVANGMSTTNVNFNKAGLGDKGAKALAIALNIRPNKDIQAFLDNNSIGKEGCVALAGALRGHTGLQRLVLNNNSIEKEGCVALAGALRGHTGLQWLGLTNNSIEKEGCVALAGALRGHTGLQELYLNNNSIEKEGCVALAGALRGHTGLQELYLSNNSIEKEGCVALAGALRGHTGLQELFLSNNSIEKEGCVALAGALRGHTGLQELFLNNNSIEKEGCVALAGALRGHTGLQELYLDDNSIEKEGCVALAGALRGHTGLYILGLSNNSIEKEGCVALAGALREHTRLQTLWLQGIGDAAARAFGAKWPPEGSARLFLTTSERAAFDEGQWLQAQVQAPSGNDIDLARLREEIERLQRDVQEKDQQLQRSDEENKRLRRVVQKKKQLLQHKGDEVQRLQRDVQEKDQQLQRNEKRLRQLEDQAESFFNLNLDPARFTTKNRVRDNKGKPVKGAFGKLYRSTLAGHDVALKEVDDVEARPRLQHLLTEMYSTTASDVDSKRVLREVAVLASLRHPNIVPFLGLCYDNDRNTLSFVLSWAENGSLYDYTHVHKKNLSDVDKLRILSEVAAAMEFLHAHNVVHRDLKSPNVLLDASLSAKVTDFGLSAFVSEDASTMTHVRGTRFWESPEQLFGHDPRADTDVFSFGCVVWEVWFGVVPWHHGPYSEKGIVFGDLVFKYSKHEYLPLDEEINGRRLTPALQALLRGSFDASGNRVDFSQLHAALKSRHKKASEQQADDLREQHLLLHGPPDAVWKFPQQLLAAVEAAQLSTRQSVYIAPLQLDEDAVTELVHAAGGRTAEQNPREPFGRTLCRVAITWCDQKLVAFNGALHRNTTRYRGHLTSAGHPFAPKYDHDTTTGQATDAEERAVLERVTRVGVYSMLDPSLLPKDPPLRIQRVFHGVGSFDAVLGILGGDFAQLQKTDKGWYGAGFYFTPDLDYARAYAQPCNVSADHDNVPADLRCLNLEPGKPYRIVLACDVMYGNPYPVLDLHLNGKPLAGGHDAHVAVVDFTSGKVKAAQPFETHSQWTQGDNVPAAEIVVTDPSCVLVRAILVFEA
ncbi:serine/threonine protein kinase [Salpingoeca rosetta]|uniref:Serine/threonine protein kinase n=1 Tax=Salpingoeca rosetta (strain ATCC 50818 / BSB-021) TaxID=946362 RepID=F2UK74_SALR5|nr:serine/threonine protein kinase [Salpingoeca rosetta]EGD77523.1 serine/threonine protein kinase [Salpingoeca rosetta]|eukprot:XP_004990411.1 serine/threonine protein kinase [Salpingoeca rosetta]